MGNADDRNGSRFCMHRILQTAKSGAITTTRHWLHQTKNNKINITMRFRMQKIYNKNKTRLHRGAAMTTKTWICPPSLSLRYCQRPFRTDAY